MTNVNYSVFYPYIRPEVIKCPTPTIQAYTRNVCKEFCEKTQAWKYTCATVNIVAATQDYALVLPGNTQIAVPVWVTYDGTPLDPASEDSVLEVSPFQASTNTSRTYEMRTQGEIHLNFEPTGNIADGLEARVSLAPDETSTEVDDVLFTRWRDIVSDGVKARLMLMKNKQWSDPVMGKHYEAQYRGSLNEAMMTVSKGYTNQSRSVQMRPFA